MMTFFVTFACKCSFLVIIIIIIIIIIYLFIYFAWLDAQNVLLFFSKIHM